METDPSKVHYLTKKECEQKSAELKKKQEDDPNFMMELKFIKDDIGWYADVPNHTRSQNSMVCGADKLLDIMAEGGNELIVRFRTMKNDVEPIFTMRRLTHMHGIGATYLVMGISIIPFPAYLCDVTHDVLGEHRKHIYVYSIEHKNGKEGEKND